MKQKLSNISGYFNVETLKNDKRVVVFLVCLFIATVFWFLNALSKDYTTTISYPVKYVNAPKKQFLSNTPPSKLDLKVEAHGFTLLRHKLNLSFSPIILNLSNITKNINSDAGLYNVKTNDLMRRISGQVSNEITITGVQPEVIQLILDSLKTKQVEVRPNIQMEFKPQFNLKEPVKTEPAKIKITGPGNIIDTISFLETEQKVFHKLDSDVKKSMDIIHPENTSVVPNKVTIKIPVEKFTEKEINIPIQVKNKPNNVSVKLFPSEIKMTVLVGLGEYENITAANYSVTVDYNKIEESGETLEINIEKKPSFVQTQRYSPKSVEYLTETN